jgi:hypothetical protein
MKGRHGRRPAGKVSAHLDHPAGEGWRRFNAEAAYAQSILRSALGDAQGCVAALRQALEVLPTYAPAILSMGSVQYQKGRRATGRRLFLSLLGLLCPGSWGGGARPSVAAYGKLTATTEGATADRLRMSFMLPMLRRERRALTWSGSLPSTKRAFRPFRRWGSSSSR